MTNSKGFTLIEILIALMIFAIIAVVSAVGLHTITQTHEHLQSSNARLRQVLTAVTLIQQDITQIVQRNVADISGSQLPALLIPNRTSFEFTRMGYSNPQMMENRSTLQRVGYEWDNNKLYRLTWPVLDRAPHTTFQKRIILTQVQQFSLSYVDDHGQLTEVWADNYHLPSAIIIKMDLKNMGQLQLILPITGRGYAN